MSLATWLAEFCPAANGQGPAAMLALLRAVRAAVAEGK